MLRQILQLGFLSSASVSVNANCQNFQMHNIEDNCIKTGLQQTQYNSCLKIS